MKINIPFKRALVVDVWRSAGGELCALGHDIEPRSVVTALDRAARLMRQQLRERGDEQIDVDTEIERLTEPGIEPRRENEILRSVVYAMGERLCPPGEDVLNVEIGEQVPAYEPN